MALVLADRVRETTTTTGTGSVTLGGAYTGFQTFLAGVGNNNSTYYTIANVVSGEWEVGIGTYTTASNLLSRTTVLASSNAGSLVNFGAGSKDVFVTQPAERAVYVDGTDVVPANSASLKTTYGGTGVTSYTAGDVPYFATGTALSKLGIGAANTVLTSSGSAPQWSTSINISGSVTAATDSSFNSTGALKISVGTTGERPTGAVGKIRWNSTLSQYEGYDGANWTLLGGAVISNDTSTASNLYPVFSSVTTGNASTLYTGNAKLLYKPSTGELQASVPVALNGIVVNSQTVATSYTIAAGFSGMSAGPITVASGQAVTVSSGSRWVIQ
jgi:hypothetical protein